MNDRFKFRFYDKDKKIMIKPSAEMSDIECKKVRNTYGQDEWWWCIEAGMPTIFKYFDTTEYEKKDFAIMQCTGLKDKNGTLIYDGDIVRFEEIYECACFTNIKEVLFKIVWSDYSFKAKQIKIIQGNKSYKSPLTLSKLLEIEPYTEHQTTINLEVIGNIYENKEILEDNQ